MTWDYRVVFFRGVYGIKEVYYDRDNKIKNWTHDFIGPIADTEESLRIDLNNMKRAYDRPHLVETSEGLVEENVNDRQGIN